MNVDLLIVVLTIVTNLGLGTIVFLRNPKKLANRIFTGMILAVSTWALTNFMADNSKIPSIALFSAKLTFVAAIWIGYFLLDFGNNFPVRLVKISKWFSMLLVLPPIILSWLSLTNKIVTGIEFKEYGVNVLLGPLYTLFMIFFLLYFFTALVFLIIQHRNSKHLEKAQLNYVFTGLLLAGTLASLTNLIIPFITKSAEFSKFGPFFTVIFVGFTANAIIKAQLFDIRVIATETLAALISLGLLVDVLLSPNFTEGGLKGVLFIPVSYGGYRLVLSVREEIERRKEIQKLTQDLKKTNIRLEELDRLKSEFLSVASHELNSPMAIILGYLHMILYEGFGKVDKEARTYLEKVYMKTNQLAHLVADLLNVSRIEQGRIKLDIKPIDIIAVLKDISEDHALKAKEKGLTFTYHEPKSPIPQVLSDTDKLKEIVQNLLSNAIKFTKTGGVEVSVGQKNGMVQVSIKDTGVGIPKEAQQHIFEKFYRVDNSWVREVGGTGLGLYITREYLKLMGGQIWFESAGENKGTTFHFTLPIAKGGAQHEVKELSLSEDNERPDYTKSKKDLAKIREKMNNHNNKDEKSLKQFAENEEALEEMKQKMLK